MSNSGSAVARSAGDDSRKAFVALVATSIGLFVVTAALGIAAAHRFVSSSAWVDHTLEVRHEIAQLGIAMWQAESTERGYVITGRGEYIAPYGKAKDAAFAEVQRVRELTRDNDTQQTLVAELETRVRERFTQMDSVIDTRRTEGEAATAAVIQTNGNVGTMEAIRSKLDEMQAAEDALLVTRRVAQDAAATRSIVLLAVTSVLFGLFVTTSASWARTSRRRRENAEANAARLSAENAVLAERERTTEFQEKFLAVLGHDLRNPLSSIRLGVRLLQRLPPDQHAATLERVDSSAARMQRMIDQILDLTRSRIGGGITVEHKPVNLAKLVADVVAETSRAHGDKSVTLNAEGEVDGRWDPDRLAQVVSNLVGNALAYGDDGSVKVDVVGSEDHVRLIVKNGGPPIPEALERVLFDPFRRGERDSKAGHTAGLGLGLFITHAIVVAHGGTIDVNSNDTDGTTFTVQLPR